MAISIKAGIWSHCQDLNLLIKLIRFNILSIGFIYLYQTRVSAHLD